MYIFRTMLSSAVFEDISLKLTSYNWIFKVKQNYLIYSNKLTSNILCINNKNVKHWLHCTRSNKNIETLPNGFYSFRCTAIQVLGGASLKDHYVSIHRLLFVTMASAYFLKFSWGRFACSIFLWHFKHIYILLICKQIT